MKMIENPDFQKYVDFGASGSDVTKKPPFGGSWRGLASQSIELIK